MLLPFKKSGIVPEASNIDDLECFHHLHTSAPSLDPPAIVSIFFVDPRRFASLRLNSRNIYPNSVFLKLIYVSPACSSSLSTTQKRLQGKVQKRECKIIFGPSHTTIHGALNTLILTTLSKYHLDLIQIFDEKLLLYSGHLHLLPPVIPRP